MKDNKHDVTNDNETTTPEANTESGQSELSDLVMRLREHADRVAGGGPGDENYDPETLAIEHEAADSIKSLYSEVELLRGALERAQRQPSVCEFDAP